jgi:hypothetical protein
MIMTTIASFGVDVAGATPVGGARRRENNHRTKAPRAAPVVKRTKLAATTLVRKYGMPSTGGRNPYARQ